MSDLNVKTQMSDKYKANLVDLKKVIEGKNSPYDLEFKAQKQELIISDECMGISIQNKNLLSVSQEAEKIFVNTKLFRFVLNLNFGGISIADKDDKCNMNEVDMYE